MVAYKNEIVSSVLETAGAEGTVTTTDEQGNPYSVVSPFLHLNEDGFLVHLELLETSRTNRNLLHSLWFDRHVVVSVAGRDGRNIVIRGVPAKATISGPVFRKYYEQARNALGDADLATVWFIAPYEVINETYAVRKEEEEARYPFSIHIDRLAAGAEDAEELRAIRQRYQ
jgi:hypothetical protein